MAPWQWQQIGDSWILSSTQPRAIVHFLGGAFVGSQPQIFFPGLLYPLARSGLAVIATCYNTESDHAQIARRVTRSLNTTQKTLGWSDLPVFGLGQSLGGKLQILSCILEPDGCGDRRGNILFAYNNSSLADALPWKRWGIEPLAELARSSNLYPFPEEFEPSPTQTNFLIQTQYAIAPNLLIKFNRDTIDEIKTLYSLLLERFPDHVTFRLLSGDHGTGVSQPYPVQIDQITPLDTIGQYLYESLNRETLVLAKTIQRWIDHQLISG